jgi:hypothetical protein
MQADEMMHLKAALRTMKADILNEKKLLNDYQQQKEKVESFWEMEKEKRNELKMELRNKLRQKQDLEEKHNFELKVYKRKVKHLLHEQQSVVTDVRIGSETALRLDETGKRKEQHLQAVNNRQLKKMLKERELQHYELIKSIKQQQEREIMQLRQDYERMSEELKLSYEKKMRVVRDRFDDERKQQVQGIEQRKASHIAKLMAKHKQAFDDIKNYYRDTTHNNLDLIKTLKEEVAEMKKKEQAVEKDVHDVSRINKKLSQPLQRNLELVDKLTQDMEVYRVEKLQLGDTSGKLVVVEEKEKNLSWEHEILMQRMEQLQEENVELRQKLETSVYDVQQKSGFRNLLLERQLQAMSHDLEKTEAALDEVLASTNLQPDVIGDIQHNLEDVLMAKNKLVQQLEDRLQELKEKYAATILLYESKLAEYEVPREELGFNPVRRF